MVAPTYSEARRTMAKSIGLGRQPGQTNEAKAEAAKPAPRKRKADAFVSSLLLLRKRPIRRRVDR